MKDAWMSLRKRKPWKSDMSSVFPRLFTQHRDFLKDYITI